MEEEILEALYKVISVRELRQHEQAKPSYNWITVGNGKTYTFEVNNTTPFTDIIDRVSFNRGVIWATEYITKRNHLEEV